MFSIASNPPLSGRDDLIESPIALRAHQVITACSIKEMKPSSVALVGFACDKGVEANHGRIGARNGPFAIREQLGNLAWHSNQSCYYLGDVITKDESLEELQIQLADKVCELLGHDIIPIVLGGGHEVARGSHLGVIKANQSDTTLTNLAIVNFDAHFDLRKSKVASSGTPFSQIEQDRRGQNLDFSYFVLGVSEPSNTQALFERAAELNCSYILDFDFDSITNHQIIEMVEPFDAIHLSIDLDVLQASVMPAVSAPASYGVTLFSLERLIRALLATKKVRLVELAELNPTYDIDNHGAKIASRLIHTIVHNLPN
jgi:formiminoglutamase